MAELTLPCDCIPGQFLCEEAQHLWQLVNNAYAVVARDFDNEAAYNEYHDRLDAYHKHIEESEGEDELRCRFEMGALAV